MVYFPLSAPFNPAGQKKTPKTTKHVKNGSPSPRLEWIITSPVHQRLTHPLSSKAEKREGNAPSDASSRRLMTVTTTAVIELPARPLRQIGIRAGTHRCPLLAGLAKFATWRKRQGIAFVVGNVYTVPWFTLWASGGRGNFVRIVRILA